MRESSPSLTCNLSCGTCNVSHVTIHLSPVICHMSPVTCRMLHAIFFFLLFFFYKLVKLVGGGSVINMARPVYFFFHDRGPFNWEAFQTKRFFPSVIQLPWSPLPLHFLAPFGHSPLKQFLKKKDILSLDGFLNKFMLFTKGCLPFPVNCTYPSFFCPLPFLFLLPK